MIKNVDKFWYPRAVTGIQPRISHELLLKLNLGSSANEYSNFIVWICQNLKVCINNILQDDFIQTALQLYLNRSYLNTASKNLGIERSRNKSNVFLSKNFLYLVLQRFLLDN